MGSPAKLTNWGSSSIPAVPAPRIGEKRKVPCGEEDVLKDTVLRELAAALTTTSLAARSTDMLAALIQRLKRSKNRILKDCNASAHDKAFVGRVFQDAKPPREDLVTLLQMWGRSLEATVCEFSPRGNRIHANEYSLGFINNPPAPRLFALFNFHFSFFVKQNNLACLDIPNTTAGTPHRGL